MSKQEASIKKSPSKAKANTPEYTWHIEMGDEKSDFKHFGTFTGTKKSFNILREAIETYIDTEAGWNKSFKYTKEEK